MVKEPKKARKLQSNPFLKELEPHSNTMNSVNFPNKKPKSQIDKDYYQKNKERKKQRRRERYQQQKEQAELTANQQQSKYYEAKAIKILMSFKEYTELNKDKMKLWQDFNWTLKDCKEAIKEGLGDIVAIMKLAQVADNLVRDYWTTAKQKIKKGKSWNTLSEEQQSELIKYWSYEKVRIENGYIDTAEQLENQSQAYLKELELAKFHEERGKIKCSCYDCEVKKEIQLEVKVKMKKELTDYDRQSGASGKGECPSRGKLKILEEETGACKKCSENYES